MEINLGKLPFDIDFHPSDNLVSAALINGDFLLYPPPPPPLSLFLNVYLYMNPLNSGFFFFGFAGTDTALIPYLRG